MSIHAELDANANKLTIAIQGRFDFSAHKDFRQSYEDVEGKPNSYAIDMREAEYIDSHLSVIWKELQNECRG